MIFDKTDQLQAMNEVYFGKTKSIQAIENQLHKFRSKYLTSNIIGAHASPRINSDPDLLQFNRMMEKEFGFGTFSLHIINSSSINAYTFPVDMRFDTKFDMTKKTIYSSTGYRFDPQADFAGIVCIYTGLIFNSHYTTEEIMGIILHEIGHNFFGSTNDTNCIISSCFKLMVWFNILMGNFSIMLTTSNTLDELVISTERRLRENNSIIIFVIDTVSWISGLAKELKTTVLGLLNILTFNSLRAVGYLIQLFYNTIYTTNIVMLTRLIVKYPNERTADNFATMYGYGPALSSAVRKMQESGHSLSAVENGINKVPVVGTLYNLVSFPAYCLLISTDEHPQAISRMSDQLDLLKREAELTGMDPKMKKAINADIAAIEKQIKEYTDTSRGVKDPDLFQHYYAKMISYVLDGKPLKDNIFDKEFKFAQYDDLYARKTSK